jgi:hypothetical protein
VKQYYWHPAYEAAVLETDNSLLPAKVETIGMMLQKRSLELRDSPADEEYKTILTTIEAVRVLRAERLPDSQVPRINADASLTSSSDSSG